MPDQFIPQRKKLRFSLDGSRSMEDWIDRVVEGVNTTFAKVGGDPMGCDTDITLVQWDNLGFRVLRQDKASQIEPLRRGEYVPRALTPLYDSIGSALTDGLEFGVHYTLIIFTDGLENASKLFTIEQIRALIEQRRQEGWVIIFLGANFDAWKIAQSLGIPQETTMNVHVRGENQVAPPPRPLWKRVVNPFGGSSSVSPVALGLGAAAGLALAYMAFRPGSGSAAPAFSDADRNSAMGVDGVNQNWRDAVDTDAGGFNEPYGSIDDLPFDLQTQIDNLPDEFDPSKGTMLPDGTQTGGFDYEGKVTSPDDVPEVIAQAEAEETQQEGTEHVGADQQDEEVGQEDESDLVDADESSVFGGGASDNDDDC